MTFDITDAQKFFECDEFEKSRILVQKAHEKLHSDIEPKPDGWLNLPEKYTDDEIKLILSEAENVRHKCDVFIVIGIGGSYLGARAAIEFLHSQNYNFLGNSPKIFFVGNSLSSDDITEILGICQGKDVCINVISKSGSTTEPAISFRIFRKFLEEKYGVEEASKRIYCTTENDSDLKKLADKMGYKFLEIPKNVGGRYSVLTPVGLFPIAVSGADIKEILLGARDAMNEYGECDIDANDCYKYAAIRNILYKSGRKIEMLIGYHSRMHYLLEWWKQLFGESEGKEGKGIFPASAMFSTDLHSLGQYIQDGPKIMFETTINVKNSKNDVSINIDNHNIDNLNYLSGKTVNFVNQKAMEATVFAHSQGGVPNMIINIDEFSEYNFGYLVYFFEKACAISAYILGVDPFNQPGVENYKRQMFKLLGKPNLK